MGQSWRFIPAAPGRHLAFHLSSSSTRCYLPIRESERRLYGRSRTSSCTSQDTCRITQGFHHKITTFAAAHSGRSSTPLIYSETHSTLSITSPNVTTFPVQGFYYFTSHLSQRLKLSRTTTHGSQTRSRLRLSTYFAAPNGTGIRSIPLGTRTAQYSARA